MLTEAFGSLLPTSTARRPIRRSMPSNCCISISRFAVPIVGGLPIGHHADARSILVGAMTEMDAENGILS
jgi:hypothetical protein